MGLPRNVSNPSTLEDHGAPDDEGSTQPGYTGWVVVAEGAAALVVDVVARGPLERGGAASLPPPSEHETAAPSTTPHATT